MSGNRRVSERGHRPLRLFGLTQYLFFIRRLEGRLGGLQPGPLACPGLISITSGSSTAGQHRNIAQMQKCPPPARRAPPAFWGPDTPLQDPIQARSLRQWPIQSCISATKRRRRSPRRRARRSADPGTPPRGVHPGTRTGTLNGTRTGTASTAGIATARPAGERHGAEHRRARSAGGCDNTEASHAGKGEMMASIPRGSLLTVSAPRRAGGR